MAVDAPAPPQSPFLTALPDLDLVRQECPRRARTQLDLLLLAIEALDLGGSEAMLAIAKDLDLDQVIRGRVHLWLLRSTNPMRRYSQRNPLSMEEAKALAVIISALSRRLTVLIRQLIAGYQQLVDKQLSVDHYFRLADYLLRFRSHFRARMNPRRAGVIAYDTDEKLNQLAISLLSQLLMCSGARGSERLWVSLFDGEVE